MCDKERLRALEVQVAKQTEILVAIGDSLTTLAKENLNLRHQLTVATTAARIAQITAEDAIQDAELAVQQTWVTLIMRYCARLELYDAVDDPDLLWAAWRGFHAMISGPDEPCPPVDPQFLESMRWSARAAGLRHQRSPVAQARRTNDRVEAHLEVRI